MPLKESGEMYLETIYLLSKSKSAVHAVDVAEQMKYSKPSVSRAVGLLKEKGHISVDNGGEITLTQNGKELAESIFERHTVLEKVLESLGVDKKIAAEDACRIEHVISTESFEALKRHINKYK